jgi:hypothetical protein
MHNPFDQLAKKVGKEALNASGSTIVQYEISRDAQHADLRHDPDPARSAERARLGLLGRLAEVLCLIEIYSHAPGGAEIRACMSKHFAHWEEQARKTRARNKKRKEKGLPPEIGVEPVLWIIAAVASMPMLQKLEARAGTDWPRGVYFVGDDVFRTGIVVASELSRDRSTLLVRVMAAGGGLVDALAELAALPKDAHERAVAEGIVVHLQDQLARKSSRTPEEEELIVTIRGGIEDWKARGRDEGRAMEAARAVLTAFRVRGMSVADVERARILAETDLERLERWYERAILASSISEVIDEPT